MLVPFVWCPVQWIENRRPNFYVIQREKHIKPKGMRGMHNNLEVVQTMHFNAKPSANGELVEAAAFPPCWSYTKQAASQCSFEANLITDR